MTDRTMLIPNNLLAIDIHSFKAATRDIGFDVYIKLSKSNLAHVFSRTTGLDYSRLAQYIQKGVKELYIHPEDQENYRQFISRSAESILADPNASQEKKTATLLNMTEQNMAEIFSQFSIEEETADKTQRLIKNYVTLMMQSPDRLAIILKLASHGKYLYYHSIAVSIFSIVIARATGQLNQKMIELVGLGGFLHDIGCTQLPPEIVCSPGDLKEDQWKEMQAHPKIGLKMIESTRDLPDEVRYIIYQHHEEPEGHGYPNGLRGDAIYYLARIVAVADAFNALISDRPFRKAYSVEKALQIMQNAPGKFEPHLVQIATSLFLPAKQAK